MLLYICILKNLGWMKEMREDLINSKNQLIETRRKKKLLKKSFIFIVLLVSILITLCLKLPYFNIKEIVILNNKNVAKEEIIGLSNLYKGNNIFYINLRSSQRNILTNSYILDAAIKRKLPNIIEISVKERNAMFYNKKDNKFLVIDKNGIVLEEKENINNMKLIRLEGFDFENAQVGKTVPTDDNRKIKIITSITELVNNSNLDMQMTIADVSDITNIKVYYNNMCIKLGTDDDLHNKLNKAINIIIKNDFKNSKGYVDVSFNGNPVFFTEK